MRFGVLGPVEVVGSDGRERPLTSPTQRLMLAVLASRVGQVTSRDTLIDAVWGDAPPKAAVSSLRAQISRLRKIVVDAIEADGDGYRLAVDPASLDIVRFERGVEQADGADAAGARDLLIGALGEWRGDAFGELADNEHLSDEARRLDAARVDARQRLAAAELELGRCAVAAAIVEEIVAADPFRERAWATLVRARCGEGRAADALRSYQRAVAALADVGLEPGPDLRAAEREAFVETPVPRPAPGSAHRGVPEALTELVGRDDELARGVALLDQARLVTLLGPGGVGKTRLATAMAAQAADQLRLGACMAPLATVGIGDDDAVADALARALGLRGAAALVGAGDRDALVVLDNCEHVIDGAARLAADLLASGSKLRIVATSRERLGVDGEHVIVVSPLDASTPESPAVDLFEHRARAAGAIQGFDRHLAAAIARRLDGLPLTIEMAAARLSSMTLDELAEAVETDIGTLRQRRRDIDDRHRTLEAVLEWSEQLLDGDQRRALADLSVFAGAVGRADVAGVLGDAAAIEQADQLAERSLLVIDRMGDRSAYRMLDTVRAHGRSSLAVDGRLDDMNGRHARWFAAVLDGIDERVRSHDEPAAHADFDRVFDEVRVAHRWARHHDAELAARLSERAHVAATAALRGEMAAWIEDLAGETEPGSSLARRVAAVLAPRLTINGRLDEARRYAEAVLTVADDDRPALLALEALSDASLFAGQLDRATDAGTRLRTLADQIDDPYFAVTSRVNLALSLAYDGDPDAGFAMVEDPDTRFPGAAGWLAYARGEVILDQDVSYALTELDDAVRVAVDVGNRFLAGVALVSASSLRARAGDPGEAVSAFIDLLDHYADTGDRSQQLTTLKNLVVLLTRIDEPTAAVELATAAADHPASPTYGAEAARLTAAVDEAAAAIGAGAAATARDLGRSRNIDQAAAAARRTLTGHRRRE